MWTDIKAYCIFIAYTVSGSIPFLSNRKGFLVYVYFAELTSFENYAAIFLYQLNIMCCDSSRKQQLSL